VVKADPIYIAVQRAKREEEERIKAEAAAAAAIAAGEAPSEQPDEEEDEEDEDEDFDEEEDEEDQLEEEENQDEAEREAQRQAKEARLAAWATLNVKFAGLGLPAHRDLNATIKRSKLQHHPIHELESIMPLPYLDTKIQKLRVRCHAAPAVCLATGQLGMIDFTLAD
jgi:archaellum component FlaD/FlaE